MYCPIWGCTAARSCVCSFRVGISVPGRNDSTSPTYPPAYPLPGDIYLSGAGLSYLPEHFSQENGMYPESRSSKVQDPSRVFVVHGRDENLRRALFDFLRAIGLKPIEWSQAVDMSSSPSPYIGDILDSALRQAQAVIVLLTGDDEGRLRQE